LFETSKTIGHALVHNLTDLLDKYDLKIFVAFVKDEGYNLNAMINALKLVVSCEILGHKKVSKELALVMFSPKQYQHGIVDEKCTKL
jgi:hypothetical protein